MAYHIICLKNQKAAKAYLDGCDTGNVTTILRGLTAVQQTLPCAILECNQAQFVPTNKGNFLSQLIIRVRQNANDTTEDDHLIDAGVIFDLFVTDSIAADLTTAGRNDGEAYTCFFMEGVSQGYRLDGDVWESELILQINCAGNDVD
jgi:hypothetical protein